MVSRCRNCRYNENENAKYNKNEQDENVSINCVIDDKKPLYHLTQITTLRRNSKQVKEGTLTIKDAE